MTALIQRHGDTAQAVTGVSELPNGSQGSLLG